MEQNIVKSAIYLFTGSFLILFAVLPKDRTFTDEDGWISFETVPYADHFYMIGLYSARITLIVLVLGVAVYLLMQLDKREKMKSQKED